MMVALGQAQTEATSPEQAAYDAAFEEAMARDFGTSEDDIEAYFAVAGSAAGAAACTAMGAPVLAPACAYLGGEIGGWIASTFFGHSAEEEERHRAQSASWAQFEIASEGLESMYYFFPGTVEIAVMLAQGLDPKKDPKPDVAAFMAHQETTGWGAGSKVLPSAFDLMKNWPWPSDMPSPKYYAGVSGYKQWLQTLYCWVVQPVSNNPELTSCFWSKDANWVTSNKWKAQIPVTKERLGRALDNLRGALSLGLAPTVAKTAAREAKEAEFKADLYSKEDIARIETREKVELVAGAALVIGAAAGAWFLIRK